MARCYKCNRFVLFFRLGPDHLCRTCSDVLRIRENIERREQAERAERERKREAELWAEKLRLEAEAQEKRRLELIELSKPNILPRCKSGFSLVYKYYDVGFYVPDDLLEVASSVPPHQAISFVSEPENDYDHDAIALYYNSEKIGYVFKGKLRDMLRSFSASDQRYVVIMSRLWEDRPIFDIFFYRDAHDLLQSYLARESKTFVLTRNRSEELQENLACCDVGDEVTVEYDNSEDRYYAVRGSFEIGYFPKTANTFIERHNGCVSRVFDISPDGSGKYIATVIVAVV